MEIGCEWSWWPSPGGVGGEECFSQTELLRFYGKKKHKVVRTCTCQRMYLKWGKAGKGGEVHLRRGRGMSYKVLKLTQELCLLLRSMEVFKGLQMGRWHVRFHFKDNTLLQCGTLELVYQWGPIAIAQHGNDQGYGEMWQSHEVFGRSNVQSLVMDRLWEEEEREDLRMLPRLQVV